MKIGGVNDKGISNINVNPNDKAKNNQGQKVSEEAKERRDGLALGHDKKATYSKKDITPDMKTIEALQKESQRTFSNLIAMVESLLSKQGIKMSELAKYKREEIVVDEATMLEAQGLIGEGGDLSPEKVSDNIVEFAKSISGGDKSKIDSLIAAIDEGFAQAAKIFGGNLPEISNKTYEMVMDKLENWRNEE